MLSIPVTRGAADNFEAETVTVLLCGVVDAQQVRTMHRSIIDALRRYRPARINIDFAACTTVDAAAVREFRLCLADAAQLDCRLVAIRAPAPIKPILRAAGMIEFTDTGGRPNANGKAG